MLTLEKFLSSQLSLLVYKDDNLIFESTDSDLIPLMKFIEFNGFDQSNLTIFDSHIGRAAALLIALIQADMVYTGVISESGALVLEENKIPCEANDKVQYLMGVASEAMCKWEKLAVDKTPQQLYKQLLENQGASK